MTELILIRHGETDWNRELRFQGQIDVPLNAVGHEQARRLGLRLAGESLYPIASSDLIRARQTAEALMPAVTAQRLALDAALREQNFGVVDGMRVADIQAEHPQAWAQWTAFDADYAFAGGESTRQFHARVLDALLALARQHAGQVVLVVTHGGVLDMVHRTAQALPLSGPRQCSIPNGALNRVRIDGSALQILDWADVQHLADMPAQPVYDQGALARPRAA